MGKINGCLKCLFIFFNVLYAILGCVLIFGAAKASIYSTQVSAVGGPSMGWGWVFAIGILAISCLGIFAGFSEKELALKIFAGFMGGGMIIMMIFGIIIVVSRNKIRDNYGDLVADITKPIMENEGMREQLDAIQGPGQCCGVGSAADWGDRIPESCHCMQGGYGAYGGLGGDGCTSKPQGIQGPDQIYAQSCSAFFFVWINIIFQVAMAFFFGFAVTALLGLLVSILMIHQVRRYDGAGGSSIAMKGY